LLRLPTIKVWDSPVFYSMSTGQKKFSILIYQSEFKWRAVDILWNLVFIKNKFEKKEELQTYMIN